MATQDCEVCMHMVKNAHTNGLGIPTQGSNGVHVYFYKGGVDLENIKIKDDMKATGSEEVVCKLNMEATGTNIQLHMQESYLLKNSYLLK